MRNFIQITILLGYSYYTSSFSTHHSKYYSYTAPHLSTSSIHHPPSIRLRTLAAHSPINNYDDNSNTATTFNVPSFWHSVKPPDPNKSHNHQLPFRPDLHLDPDGPLPSGCYHYPSTPTHNGHKPSCLLTVALSVFQPNSVKRRRNGNPASIRTTDEIDLSRTVSSAQSLIDGGFTSFQMHTPPVTKYDSRVQSELRSLTEQIIYRNIIQDTPSSVLAGCNLATRLEIPSCLPYLWNDELSSESNGLFKRSYVRELIGTSIRNMYGTTLGQIDTLQVTYPTPQDPLSLPYTYDILDVLFDMQREGHIRSITGLNFPLEAVRQAQQMGFRLDTNQIDCSLVDTSFYQPFRNQQQEEGREGTHNLCIGDPTAGGLLTQRFGNVPDRYRDRYGMPVPGYITSSPLYQFTKWSNGRRREILRREAEEKAKERSRRYRTVGNRGRIAKREVVETSWQTFERVVMGTLGDIATKHCVSISSVVSRWSMHLSSRGEGGGSGSIVAVTDDLGMFSARLVGDEDVTATYAWRTRELREVFSFELDEHDLERLTKVSGVNLPPKMRGEEGMGGRKDGFRVEDYKGLWL